MAKTIDLKVADLESGETAKMRDFKYTPAGGSEVTIKALLTEAVTIPAGGGSIPAGYEERLVTLYCKGEKLTATILVKTSGLSSTAYGSADKRLLLQVTEPSTGTYELQLDKGYLKA